MTTNNLRRNLKKCFGFDTADGKILAKGKGCRLCKILLLYSEITTKTNVRTPEAPRDNFEPILQCRGVWRPSCYDAYCESNFPVLIPAGDVC